MAIRSKRPCRRCRTLTSNKSGLCNAHELDQAEQRRTAGRERNQEFLHLYGTAWKKARAAFLRENPLCAECQRQGRLTPANTVDHVKAHRGDLTLFWDRSNWEALCRSCHSRVTAARDGGFGNKPSNKASQSCGVDGLPTDVRHHWNR